MRRTAYGGVIATGWVGLIVAAMASSNCKIPAVQSNILVHWAVQQSIAEERVRLTCQRLRAGAVEKHNEDVAQEHQWRIESLSKRLVQAAKEVRPCPQAGKQPCSDKELANAAKAIIAKCSSGQTECPDAISKAIKGIEGVPKDNNTLTAWLGMIKATGGDGPDALLKTAAKLEFARAAVYGMVQAAEAMDVLIDDLVRGLGAFAPVARPVLREIASHLLAFVARSSSNIWRRKDIASRLWRSAHATRSRALPTAARARAASCGR